MCHRVTRQFDCHPTSVTAGRHFAAEALARWGLTPGSEPTARDDILLVTAELLSNAVKAASGPVVLFLERHHTRVDVSVVDDSPATAVVLAFPDIDSPGGRGLRIVEALSQHWGQRPVAERTKEVWAQLAVPAHSALAVHCTLPHT